MRGTHPHHQEKQDGPRFIPAHAGNSPDWEQIQTRYAVHPRACGELLSAVPGATHGIGSSPRMRGTQRAGWRSTGASRFIPAHAGNSPASSRHGPAWPVHPRACGELCLANAFIQVSTGSSPRMRGTRITSTWAGLVTSVHPRACGELIGPSRYVATESGSSPRMRTLFIGNSTPAIMPRPHRAVHPRACGEL